MTEPSRKDQLLELIRADPLVSQQELADQSGLSRSAVAGHVASLIRERRLLGRAYVLPDQRPILCVGAANLDRKLRGIKTLQMGTSNPALQHESFGGVARNLAENLARLGTPVALLTALGTDGAGDALHAHAERCGIDMRPTVRVPHAATGTYTAVLDDDGEMLLALADMALYEALTPDLLSARQADRPAAALTVADLNLPRACVAHLLADAARGATPLVLVAVSQPKMARLPDDLTGLRLLILNRGELAIRVGRPLTDEADFQDACRLVQRQGARDVIVTLGRDGVFHTTPNGINHLSAPPAHIVDVTGAGDAFAAAVCWSLFRHGDDLSLACRRALRLAAMTLACPQTVCPEIAPDSLERIGLGLGSDSDAASGALPSCNTIFQD